MLFFLFLGNRGLISDGIISNFLRSIPVPVVSSIWESFSPGVGGGGGGHRIGDMYTPLFKEYYTCLVPVSQCTVFFQAFSVIFFSMTYPRPRKTRGPKREMRPRLTWRRTTHKTKTDGNIFLFAYANGTVVEKCASEGFHQIGGLKVSGYSARAERFFGSFLHKLCYKETIS